MTTPRDELGLYIPRRISTMSDEEILAEIEALQKRREAVLLELAKEKAVKRTRSSKPKVVDLTKLDADEALLVLATQMGMTLDELKRYSSTK